MLLSLRLSRLLVCRMYDRMINKQVMKNDDEMMKRRVLFRMAMKWRNGVVLMVNSGGRQLMRRE